MSVIDQALLAESLGKLDAGTRALLDLSLRRAIPDDQVAQVLGVDAASIPPRRARGIAQLADMMEVPGPSELAALLIAIPDLPEAAWGVPTPEPFKGGVTLAGRAKAFRRVAVAASPLVALGAVMAAVLVSSSDHSGPAAGSSVARGTGIATGGSAVTVPAPEARHGLPSGVQLSRAERPARAAHHGARHRRARHRAGTGQAAILARQPAATVEHSTPVAYHPPAVVPQQPRHVTHHHTPSTPKGPTQTPAPVQTPSQPVTTPAPTQPTSPAVQVSPPQQTTTVHSGPSPSPGKPQKTPPPPVTLNPPGGDDESSDDVGGGHCGDRHGGSSYGQSSDHGSSHHDWQGDSQGHSSSGRSFTPPGLFRKHHGGH